MRLQDRELERLSMLERLKKMEIESLILKIFPKRKELLRVTKQLADLERELKGCYGLLNSNCSGDIDVSRLSQIQEYISNVKERIECFAELEVKLTREIKSLKRTKNHGQLTVRGLGKIKERVCTKLTIRKETILNQELLENNAGRRKLL